MQCAGFPGGGEAGGREAWEETAAFSQRKAVAAWARRVRGGQAPGSAFPDGRGERGLDQPRGPAQARLSELQPGLPSPPATRTGGQCGPVGTSTAFGADWNCVCVQAVCPQWSYLASLDPRLSIHKTAIITSNPYAPAR